jgi:hypothetical protein
VALALLASSGSSPGRKAVTARAGSATARAGSATARTPVEQLRAAPTTVAGAVGALTALTSQDVRSGQIDRHAAQPVLAQLAGVLSAYDNGNIDDAVHHVEDLRTHIAQLSVHGDISPSALPAVDAALNNLGAALARALPPATSVAREPGTPSHGPRAGGKSPPGKPRAPKQAKPAKPRHD